MRIRRTNAPESPSGSSGIFGRAGGLPLPLLRLPEAVAQARLRGAAGGVIPPHRALYRVPLRRIEVVGAALVAAAGVLGWALIVQPVCDLWGRIFVRGMEVLELPGHVGADVYHGPGSWELRVPRLEAPSGAPEAGVWLVTAIGVILLLLASVLVPARRLPLRYFLRVVAALQGTALLFFALVPAAFPYRMVDHTTSVLASALWFITIIPVVLGLTYSVFGFALWRQFLLVALAVGHMAVFVPLQVLLHAWVLNRGSLLFMPLLFILFGLLPAVMVLVALYGWGMSWRTPGSAARLARQDLRTIRLWRRRELPREVADA